MSDHFAFGENWKSFAAGIRDEQIKEAEIGLLKLIPKEKIVGSKVMDIGCGSGLHSLAAARLGAKSIVAIDFDVECVKVTKALLETANVAAFCTVERADILHEGTDENLKSLSFDVVYSWGVLHHTGNMWRAIERSASFTKEGGLFVFALYRETHMDRFWKLEKKIYSQANPAVQQVFKLIYVAAFRLGLFMTGRRFSDFLRNYKAQRGMDFYHDVHDWLGGYLYETASPQQVDLKLKGLGFVKEKAITKPKPFGLLGSGCDEYVYRQQT